MLRKVLGNKRVYRCIATTTRDPRRSPFNTMQLATPRTLTMAAIMKIIATIVAASPLFFKIMYARDEDISTYPGYVLGVGAE